VDLIRAFLRDGNALFLGGFLAGMSFISMNRNKSGHKVERIVGTDESPSYEGIERNTRSSFLVFLCDLADCE
jgi:hypothetical protein